MANQSQRFFLVACAVELGLLLIASVTSLTFGVKLVESMKLSLPDIVIGTVATVPLLLLFLAVLSARTGPLSEIRLFLETVVRTAFGSWTVFHIAVVSIIAGLAEESLFRGVIQAGLTPTVGEPLALLIASTIFGLCHAVNRPYTIVAGSVGLYLGVIFLVTNNLLVPIVTHALYDFVALVWFLQLRKSKNNNS